MAQAVHATPAVTMVLAWHLLSRFLTASDSSARRTPAQMGTQVYGASGYARMPKQAARPRGARKRSGPLLDKVEAG